MSKMSGIELQKYLFDLGFDIPIIFMTASPDETVRARALSAGAIGFLRKPFDLGPRLVDCLNAALDKPKGFAQIEGTSVRRQARAALREF
jgi:FixJ family two-component response regulator